MVRRVHVVAARRPARRTGLGAMDRPKTARLIVLVSPSGSEPGQLPFAGGQPADARVFGDGARDADHDAAYAYARLRQSEAAALGDRVWCWVGHDGAYLCTFWRWFACVGPADWVSDFRRANDGSWAEVARRRQAEKDAAETLRKKHAAERKATGVVRKNARKARGTDSIVTASARPPTRGDGPGIDV